MKNTFSMTPWLIDTYKDKHLSVINAIINESFGVVRFDSMEGVWDFAQSQYWDPTNAIEAWLYKRDRGASHGKPNTHFVVLTYSSGTLKGKLHSFKHVPSYYADPIIVTHHEDATTYYYVIESSDLDQFKRESKHGVINTNLI